MITKHLLIALAAVSVAATPALAEGTAQSANSAQSVQSQQDVSIPFANFGGIRDWRADGDSAVYLEDVHGNWYRAELFSPAFDLPFVEFIGIDARPTGTLDKFGAVYVAGQRYPFKSLVRIPDPMHRQLK